MPMSVRQAWRSFQAVEERRRRSGGNDRHRRVRLQRGQRQMLDQWNEGRRKNAGFIHQVLGRSLGVILVDATPVVVIVMVGHTFKVHGCMRHFIEARQRHGRAGTGQRLPAQAEHQEEGDEPTTHELEFSGCQTTRPTTRLPATRHPCATDCWAVDGIAVDSAGEPYFVGSGWRNGTGPEPGGPLRMVR